MIYRNGLLSIPFASRTIDTITMPLTIQIPAKTKPSFLFIIHQKLLYCLFNAFVPS